MYCINFSHYDSPLKAERVFNAYFPIESKDDDNFLRALDLVRLNSRSDDLDGALDGLLEGHKSIHLCGNPFTLLPPSFALDEASILEELLEDKD